VGVGIQRAYIASDLADEGLKEGRRQRNREGSEMLSTLVA
jgi:hypothetical protein